MDYSSRTTRGCNEEGDISSFNTSWMRDAAPSLLFSIISTDISVLYAGTSQLLSKQ
jgi:hypothetical protein